MKRLLAALALSASLTSLAAPQRAVVVRLADTAGVVSAVSKVGEFIGNPMLVMSLTAGLAAHPAAQFFGPAREGETLELAAYLDPDKEAKGLETLVEGMRYSVLYPVVKGKADFLKAHPDAREQDGVIAVKEPKGAFVGFSRDDTWAVLSDDAGCVREALAGRANRQKPLQGDVLRASVRPVALKALARLAEPFVNEMSGKAEQDQMKMALDLMRQITGARLALRIDEAGITVRSTMEVTPESLFAKIGAKTLTGGENLAFAGKDAVYAAAYAADCGQADCGAVLDKVTALAAKYGFDLGWAALTKQGVARTLTFDFDACVKHITTLDASKFEKIDVKALEADLSALSGDMSGPKVENPEGAIALALKGLDAQTTPAARFARMAPEAAAKKPYMVCAASLYSAVRALAPKAVALLPEEDRQAIQPLLQTLPPEGLGGMAAYNWRDGAALKGVLRVSPDEIKGLSSCATIGFGYMLQQQMKAMQTEMIDDDDDED